MRVRSFLFLQSIAAAGVFWLTTVQLSAAEGDQDPFAADSKASQDVRISAKIRRYSERIIKKHDADADGHLQPEEWASMKGQPAVIDHDRNGLITTEEFARHVALYGRYRRMLLITPETPGEAPQSYEQEASAEDEELLRRSKKYFIPASRLPKGLPPTFLSRDLDGDGQLTRAEFAPGSASERLQKFRELDANLDGIVTAREYLKGSRKTDPAPTTTGGGNQPQQ